VVASRIVLPSVPNPAEADAGNFSTSKGRPVLFQAVGPDNQPLMPYLLAMHVNPQSLDESMTKNKNVVMTVGGFVEFQWPDDLDTLSAQATTGAFIGPNAGLTSGSDAKGAIAGGSQTRLGVVGRQGTMAWERQEDLIDLFHNNGMIYNGQGQPVLRGRIMLIYDRGVFIGSFTSLEVREDDTRAFSFDVSFEYKVEATLYRFPLSPGSSSPAAGSIPGPVVDFDPNQGPAGGRDVAPYSPADGGLITPSGVPDVAPDTGVVPDVESRLPNR
jgi:hypothetical protein